MKQEAEQGARKCDRCGKEIAIPFHYVPRNGKYYFCSDECLLADYRGELLENKVNLKSEQTSCFFTGR